MSKLRSDYEKTFWRKLWHFVNGDEEEDIYPSGYADECKEFEKRQRNKFFKQAELQKKNRKMEEILEGESAWPQEHGTKVFDHIYHLLVAVTGTIIALVLLVTVSELPRFGNEANPANNEVYDRYVDKGIEETGATNVVSGVILDYRAFDTLGESHVLFVACCCVLILLRVDKNEKGKLVMSSDVNDRLYEPKNDPILQKCASLLVPVIILFGIYIILNGHLSPGGGFSGGAIIGAGLILYLNAFGFKKTERFMNEKTFKMISCASLLFYSLSKSYSFFTGANDIHSIISAGVPGRILSAGLILPLNICVGMVVACTMYCFYVMFRKGGF